MSPVHRRVRRTLVALAALASATLGSATSAYGVDGTSALDLEAVEAFVHDQLERHRIPGATLAVVDDGAVVHTAAFGRANAVEPMTADKPMPVASVTKTFTAVAVLQLVEQGRLALDAPVRDYLPWFTVDHPSASDEITVRHLLHHTSGLADRGYNRVLAEDTTLEEAVRDLRRAEPTAEVGSRHQYFNPNYAVLALLVETASGVPYGAYLTEHVTGPLGMADTYAAAPGSVGRPIAQGHRKLFGFPLAVDQRYDRWRMGADGVVSTAPDLARLAIALGGDGAFEGSRILSPRSVEQMWASHDVPGDPYGFGWVAGEHRGETVGGHSGADPAFSAELAVLPERGRGYTLLMNSDHLLDQMVALPELRAGMLDLLQGRTPADSGWLSMKVVGAAMLLVTLLVAAFAVRSARRLRGWPTRAAAMSTRQLVRAIAPQFLVPVLVWLAVYQLSPLAVGRAFNLRYVGEYYVPDLVVLLALATVPDLVLGVSMLASVPLRSGERSRTGEAPRVELTE